MASLISWGLDPRKKQQQQGNVLNTLNNLDVRTNNAIVNQTRDVRQPVASNNANFTADNNANQTHQTTWQNQSRAQTPNMLNTLNNLDVRRNNALTFAQNNPFKQNTQVNQVQKPNTALDTLAKLNQQNGGQNINGKMSFEDFKTTMNAKNAISQGGNGTPFKANAIQNAQSLINMDKNATGSLRNGDDGDYRYFTSKVMKPVLGDNAGVNGTTYKSILNSYNNASGDQQADIKKAISDEIINQREYAKKGSQGSLKVIDYLTDLGQFLDKNGNTKGKSLGKQIGDYLATGGIAKTLDDTFGLSKGLGEITGTADKTNAYLEKMDNSRQDLGVVGAADTAGNAIAQFALNAATGGTYGLASAGVGLLNAGYGTINDRILDYDENGRSYIRNKTDLEKAGEMGSAALNAAFAVAGKKGIGPSLEATGVNSATGLAKLSAKDLAKYAAKELPWAGGTTVLQTGLNNLSRGKDFFDMDASELGKEFLLNTAQDVGMDVANYGVGRTVQKRMLDNATEKAINSSPASKASYNEYMDDQLTNAVNKARKPEIDQAFRDANATSDMDGYLMRQGDYRRANIINNERGAPEIPDRQNILKANRLNRNGVPGGDPDTAGHYYAHEDQLGGRQGIADNYYKTFTDNTEVYPAKHKNTALVDSTANDGDPAATMIGRGTNDTLTITPQSRNQVEKMSQRRDALRNSGLDGRNAPSSQQATPEAGFPYPGRQATNPSVSQNGETVNRGIEAVGQEKYNALQERLAEKRTADKTEAKFETASERNKKYDKSVKYYHNKYGENFYEKMPDHLKEHYEAMLDAQPRNKDGVYTDPITGGRSIDESASAKSSKFANETVAKSEEVSENLKHKIKEDGTSYRPTSNAEHLAKSEEFMKSRTLSEAEADIADRVLNKPLGKIDDQDVSDAMAVAKALDARGDNASLERACIINESLSQHATKQGKAVQSLSLLNNRTPEGLRYGAERAIRKGGTEVTPEIHKKVVADTKKIVNAREELARAQKLSDTTAEKAKQIYSSGDKNISDKTYQDIMTEIEMNGRKLDDAKHQLDIAYATMAKTVADNKKMSVGDIYSSIHKAGLLSAPTTHIKNITSNTAFAIANKITEAPAAAADALLSKITGKRTMAFTLRGIGKGAVKGTKYGMEYMKTGIDELSGAGGGKYDSGYPELRFKGKAMDILVGKMNRGIFRAMGAGDKPHRYSAMANDLYSQGLAEARNLGIKGKAREIFLAQYVSDPPQAAFEHAFSAGERAVLGQSNRVASAINNLVQGAKNSDNLGLKALGTYLDAHTVPFNKVPTNFLIESSRYTPVGAVAEGFKLADDAIHGRGFDQEAFVRSTSKSIWGTVALLTLGGVLADNFTGEYPEDEKERNRWETEGVKENSVKMGDRYVPMEAFGHASLLIGAGAQFWKSIHEGAGVVDATVASMTQLARSLEDQSFLTGVQKTMDIIQGKQGSSAENYIKQEVASEVPNFIKKLADATDPYKRSTGKKDGVLEQTVAQVMNSVPFLRELLPAKVDAYGNDLKNGAFLSGFLDPTGSGQELQGGNEMIEEVARLHNIASDLDLTDDEKKELEVTPADIGYKFGKQGSEVTLTDAEQRELTKKTGQLISSTWQDTMQTDEYKNADDLTKARLLADGRAAAVNLAKQQFGEEHDYEAPKMTTDAKKLEKGTFKAKAKSSSGDGRKNEIEINDTIADNHKAVLEHYNSMDSDEWNKYIYGDSKESAEAEYNLAKAKYENDVANDKLTKVEKIKRQKEISKLEVSKNWSKEVRDVYSLASTKDDIQELLNGLEGEERETMVGRLNALNEAMYNAGEISKNTYTSRWRNINNFEKSSSSSSKSSSSDNSPSPALSSGAATALKAATKAIASEDLSGYKVKTSSKPGNSTMQKSQMKSYTNKKYTPKKANISVKKGK